jgi:hypothetical protein
MADEHDTLIRQVDEELRREQLLKLWEKYGLYAIAAAALIVVGVAGFKWWQARTTAAIEAAGTRYEAAANLARSTKAGEAQSAFRAIAAEGPAGYALLARLRLAGDAAKAGGRDEAVAAYDALAKDTSIDAILSGFARLQAAALRLGDADWTEMQNRLNDLMGEENAWRYSARELLGLAAYRADKLDEARQALGLLSTDPKVPPNIRERASSVMSLVVAAELAKRAPPEAAAAEKDAPKVEEPKTSPAKGAPAKSGVGKK